MKSPCSPLLLAIFAAPFAAFAAFAAVDYETQIKPILKANCYECHGGPKSKADLRMDIDEKFAESIRADGPIIPGKPDESSFIKLINLPHEEEDRMPRPGPNKNQPLKPSEKALLAQWIQEGASLEKQEPTTTTASTPDAPDPKALHVWTGAGGSEIKAFFVKIDGENIVLKSENGQEKAFPADKFSAESQELAKKLGAR